ncbi:transporter substrate-binding domain-containing protein [Moraxella canis]|uniref:Transporter substrate-binding domain-containing protein n=1 Tax=Moraxella canis TaxID=90239 RepID=A0ABZ0WZY8_9GAMM|nr:transporter substrate-binding domain-containing protein [Moraxella canis]WQE04725.1 transporter substrate-binding domain-containing protein [Moraxella canis]
MKTLLKFTAATLCVSLLAACSNDQPAANTETAANPNSSTAQRELIIATESSFKPFSYLDNQGQLVGFEIDLANALCEQMQADCQIVSQDWDSLIPSLNANKSDAIMAGMSITEERLNAVDFSEPYFDNTLVLIGKKGNAATIDDIAGKTVATQQATVSAEYLQKNYPDAIIKTYDKQDNAYLDLTAGRAEFMLSDVVPAADWLTTDAGSEFEIKGAPIDIGDKVGIAVRKGNPLKADFDAALASLKTNGKYDEIVAKYFDSQAVGQ